MEHDGWIKRLFASIDARDVNAFSRFLTDDVLFRFGNAAPVSGKKEVESTVRGFFDSIETLRHEILDTWKRDNAVICHGFATYTRRDSSTLRVPFANVFKLDGTLIGEYLIFVDVSELYRSV